MAHNFSSLSYLDFEDLVRDLIGRELGVRFEAFCAGPDGGMDGRHAAGSNALTILQAKHYAGSSFSALRTEMTKARIAIEQVGPSRYLLASSRGLTPSNKAGLAKIVGPWLKNEADIFGATDLSDLLRKYPDVEQAHIKLWLSSSAVLERVINAARHAFTAITREEIEAKVRVYATNPSLKEAMDKLEAVHVVIISGPPGVGKTTLAEMLSYAYIAEGWEYIAVRSLDDGFAKLQDSRKQIFFFDDFLGSAALDTRALAVKDSDLARFIKRVRASANARFVLTTSAPIFEEARRVSERLADKSLDVSKYVLDVGIHTRRIKARILYNHLMISTVSNKHIQALWSADAIPKIVDHKNYNPRIIEAMTDGIQVQGVAAEDYAAEFVAALNNPQRIWDVSFRTHIPTKCRHLLYALYFSTDYGVLIDELRAAFDGVNQLISGKYAVPHGPKDFEEALRILEGGYIAIRDRRVTFINPSLRDYLSDYIDDLELVCDLAAAAQKADWANRLWQHVRVEKFWSPAKQKRVAAAFLPIARRFKDLPEMRKSETEAYTWHFYDMCFADRIDLLLTWCVCSDEREFSEIALALAEQNVGRFRPYRDAQQLISLIAELKNGDAGEISEADKFIELFETALVRLLEGHVWVDDLETIVDDIDENEKYLSEAVRDAANKAMLEQIENVDALIEDVDSESTLNDHISAVRKFAPRLGISTEVVERAISKIEYRIGEINENEGDASPPSFSSGSLRETDDFDDAALANLFAPLVHGLR
jgi:DNA polymerase III delta prime subunit